MTMTDKTMHGQRVGPLWAVIGAPLVGVPLMVALLALGSRSTVDAAVEPDVGYQIEHVDAAQVEPATEAEVSLPSG